jgi:hypothetical protein
MPVLEILLTIASGAMSFLIALLIRTINRRDRKAEERQKQLIECRTAEMQYTRSIGGLAHSTAKAMRRANLCNGEVEEAMRYYRTKERALEDFYHKQSAMMQNIKGG